jgi:vitamin B12 transporter
MRFLLLATAAAAGLPLSAHARSLADDPDTLPEVVVTATRLPAIVADTPGARVIDREAIERRGAVFAADILSDIPGLSVTRSGASAGVAQVRMRGAAPGKTLVLVDGVPVNDASELNGAFDVAAFDLADIERIEVLSGPQSSLWGSDAIGGVIAFTTREIEGLRAEAEAGSFETVRGRVSAGVADETWALGAYVSRFDSDGVSAADEADGNTEADGLRATTAGVRGRYAFAPAVQMDGSLRWSSSKGDIDGTPPPLYVPGDTPDTTEAEQWSGFGRLSLRAVGLDHQLSISASAIDRVNDGDFASTFQAERQVYRWQAGGAALEDAVAFTVGAEREATEGSLSTGETAGLGTTSIFGVARVELSDRLSVTGGLRLDETDDFGSKTTGRLSAAWDLAHGFILSGAVGTGFKAPSISQAVCDYCTGLPVFPSLKPEQAEGVEAALGWTAPDDRISGRLTAYRLEIEDQISWYSVPNSWDGYYVNVATARTDGLELEGAARLGGGFDLSLAWAWTDARDESTGDRLLRVPERAGSATLGWTGERLSGALTVRTEGDQDDAGGVREAFVTANLNASYRLTRRAVLTVRIENLADEHYQQVFGYGEPGRSAYVGIRLRY